MSPQEVAEKFGVTTETVIGWCNKNYIRGLKKDTSTGAYVIPSSVREPYTATRSDGDAIYTSIVKATMKNFDVCAELYGLDPAQFDNYINQLMQAGVIDTYIAQDTGIIYYSQTLSSSDFAKLPKNKVKRFLGKLTENVPNVNINLGVNIR